MAKKTVVIGLAGPTLDARRPGREGPVAEVAAHGVDRAA